MNQPASVSSLLSPQQLMQARYQPPASSPAGSFPLQPMNSGAQPIQLPSLPRPVASPQVFAPGIATSANSFNRISALLTPDQLQRFTPPQSSSGLSNPLSLFNRVSAASPSLGMADLRHRNGIDKLKQMSPSELKSLGQNDRQAFFAALLPAAIESERKFGVPAEVTLAQAALESGWARSPIGGFNIFGIKGKGPAGSTNVATSEFYSGNWVKIKDNFALYNNFYEAIAKHGELFHNGYYDKAVNQYARDKNVDGFIRNIQGIYATDPGYSRKIKDIIESFGLRSMVDSTRMV